jgi:hypothetical protein
MDAVRYTHCWDIQHGILGRRFDASPGITAAKQWIHPNMVQSERAKDKNDHH